MLAEQLSTLRLLGAIVVAALVVWLMLAWLARLDPRRREVVLGWLEVGGFGVMVLLAVLFWIGSSR
jgi:hypothetical protein